MNRSRGFTLMEVMIALAILSFMMVAIVSSLRTFGNTRTALEKMTGQVDEIRLVSGFLRRSLESAVSVGGGRSSVPSFDAIGEPMDNVFIGNKTELTWLAPLSGNSGFSGVNVLHLRVEGRALTLRWRPYEPGTEDYKWQQLKPQVLLDEVEEFGLGYRPEYGGEWIDYWSDLAARPVSVRMNIKADGKYWPEMVLRLD